MYSEEYVTPCLIPSSAAAQTALSLVGGVADYASWYAGEQFILTRLMIIVSTTTATSTANPVVTFYARPTFGSTTGQISIGTITVPTGTAAGAILYKNVESVKIPPGYTLTARLTTQGTDASAAAGAGFVMFKGFVAPEDPRNVSLMVASA